MMSAPVLFAGIDLATRIERAEASLIVEGARGAARRDRTCQVLIHAVGSGFAVWAGADSPFDKVVGVGMGSDVDDDELCAVERAYAERGASIQFEVSTLADPSVVEQLTRRGYVVVGFENVLGLQLDPRRERRVAGGVEVHDVAPEQFEQWLDIDVEASLAADSQGIGAHEEFPRESLERAVRDFSSALGFERTIATLGGVPAGAAGLRLCDGVAQLCGAA